VLLTCVPPSAVRAEGAALEAARALAGADRDPAAIDRARDRLEEGIRESGVERADPMLLIEASRVWYLYGELRATETETKIAAFERGRVLGEEAARRAPSEPLAHLWHGINLGRWAELRGVLRSMVAVRTVKREVAETIRLAPDLPDAQAFAGGVAGHLPRFLGGDDAVAEQHLRRALALDPRRTGFRLELATFLAERNRTDEARRELLAVVDEKAPSDRLFAVLRDRPRARRLLAEIDAAAR